MADPWNSWHRAQMDLGFEIIAPFEVTLSNARKLRADFLVKHFGGENGTLVFTDYDEVELYQDELASLGYGFSILQPDREDEEYDREVFIEVLADWGWAGDKKTKPSWL